jgi:hypothetical protein
MLDTLTSHTRPGLDALVALVADAEGAGDALLSTNRLIDALLDARSDTDGPATAAVDTALGACAHRQIVPVGEAVEMVASITARV